MVQKMGKRAAYITGAILLVLLVIIGTVLTIRALNPANDDPFKRADVSTSDETSGDDARVDDVQDSKPKTNETDNLNDANNTPALDPETVGTVDIQPMELAVSYVKGVGGFEYIVQLTPSGTRYVEFRNSDLVGTKCTDDAGAFASIIEEPAANEASTLAKKTTVEGTEYGLSLSASSCTSNPELLSSYQKSFSDAFGLLKKIS